MLCVPGSARVGGRNGPSFMPGLRLAAKWPGCMQTAAMPSETGWNLQSDQVGQRSRWQTEQIPHISAVKRDREAERPPHA